MANQVNTYVIPMAENFDLMMGELATLLGFHFTGHVVQHFKLRVTIASLFYLCGKPHADAAKYIVAYLGEDYTNMFLDRWTYLFAIIFKTYMIFQIDERENCDVSIDEDDNVIIVVTQKVRPEPSTQDLVSQLLAQAEDNLDFIPESTRNALRSLK